MIPVLKIFFLRFFRSWKITRKWLLQSCQIFKGEHVQTCLNSVNSLEFFYCSIIKVVNASKCRERYPKLLGVLCNAPSPPQIEFVSLSSFTSLRKVFTQALVHLITSISNFECAITPSIFSNLKGLMAARRRGSETRKFRNKRVDKAQITNAKGLRSWGFELEPFITRSDEGLTLKASSS